MKQDKSFKMVAVVPIKLNSVRLPNKNIRRFSGGDSLCTYMLNTLLKIKAIDKVYVFCSDSVINEYIPEGVKFIERPKYLDSDSTKINEVLTCFAGKIEAESYILAHVTSPFLKASSIERGIEAVKSGKYDSAFSVRKLQEFLWQNGKPMNYKLNAIPRTQDLPLLYAETSGFYLFSRKLILDSHRRIGDKPFLVEVSEIEGVDIDDEEDFVIADALFQQQRNLLNKF